MNTALVAFILSFLMLHFSVDPIVHFFGLVAFSVGVLGVVVSILSSLADITVRK